MHGDVHFHNLLGHFAAQFEPNAAGYLYRRGGRGAPIQISAAEYDTFIAAFARFLGRAYWLLLIGTIAACTAVAVIAGDGDAPRRWFWAIAMIVIGGFVIAYYRARNAPARTLARRPALGIERSRADLARIRLAQMPYSLFVVGFGAAAVLVYAALSDAGPPLGGWHGWALGGAAATVVLLAVQFIRKQRLPPGA